MKQTKNTSKEVVADLAVDALNQVPLLGTLAKALARLHAARQRDKFTEFALRVIEGGKADEDFFDRLDGREREAFYTIFERVMADAETAKVRYYAHAYTFLVRERIFENPGLADYITTTIAALSVHDIDLVREITDMWQDRRTDAAMKEYFRELPKKQGDDIGFRWLRRSSIQKLVSLGILAHLQDDCPFWTTEQFDIISKVVAGCDLSGTPLNSNDTANA